MAGKAHSFGSPVSFTHSEADPGRPPRGARLSITETPPPAADGARRGLRNGAIFGAVALAAIIALNAAELPGLGRVVAELPAGIAIATLVHIPQIVLTGLAWGVLVPRALRPGLGFLSLIRWFREAANALVPAGAIIGQAAAARLLARRGVPGELAGATATVDLTMEAIAQLVFTLAGVALLLAVSGAGEFGGVVLAGVALAVLGAVGMVAAQRHLPVDLLERVARRIPGVGEGAVVSLKAAIRDLHARPSALAACGFWHLVAWVIGAVEVMAVLALLGHDVSFADALIIESLAQALRNAGFLLPGAFAVQEGAYLAAAALVGVPAGPALAMALIRRCREVLLGIPGLIAWQRAEMRACVRP